MTKPRASKVDWPKLVEGRTYRYVMTAPGRMSIERTWTVGPTTSIDSATHLRQAVAGWTRRGDWTVKVEEVREVPVSPEEGQPASEATVTPIQRSQASRAIVGTLEREQDGYCYVAGVPQALRRGWDIEPSAQVGDTIECSYVQRTYGHGYYGRVVR